MNNYNKIITYAGRELKKSLFFFPWVVFATDWSTLILSLSNLALSNASSLWKMYQIWTWLPSDIGSH